MIPNEFGLIRQKDKDLFALYFNLDMSDRHAIVYYPEYVDGYTISSSNGGIAAQPKAAYSLVNINAATSDVITYVLIPCTNNTSFMFRSGIRALGSTGGFTAYSCGVESHGKAATCYAMLNMTGSIQLCINTMNSRKLPVIIICKDEDITKISITSGIDSNNESLSAKTDKLEQKEEQEEA